MIVCQVMRELGDGFLYPKLRKSHSCVTSIVAAPQSSIIVLIMAIIRRTCHFYHGSYRGIYHFPRPFFQGFYRFRPQPIKNAKIVFSETENFRACSFSQACDSKTSAGSPSSW